MNNKIISVILSFAIIAMTVATSMLAFADEISDISENFADIVVGGSDGQFTDRWGKGNWRYYGTAPSITYSDVCGNEVLPGNCLLVPSETGWYKLCYIPHNVKNISSKVWGENIYYDNKVLETTFRFAVNNGGVSNSEISFAYGSWFEVKLKNGKVFNINGNTVSYDYYQNTAWNELKVLMYFEENGNGKARVILNGTEIAETFSVSYNPTGTTYYDGGSMNVSNSHFSGLMMYNYASNDNGASVGLYVDDVTMHITDTALVQEKIEEANNLMYDAEIGTEEGQYTIEQINALNAAVLKANAAVTTGVAGQSEMSTVAEQLNGELLKFQAGTIEGVTGTGNAPDPIKETFTDLEVNSTVFTDRWGSGVWRFKGSTPSIVYSDVCGNEELPGNCLSIPSESSWNPVMFIPHSTANYQEHGWGPDVYYDGQVLDTSFRFAAQNTGVSDSQISIKYSSWFEVKLRNGNVFEINGTGVNVPYYQNSAWNELRVLLYFEKSGNGKGRVFLNGTEIAKAFTVSYNSTGTTYYEGGSMTISNKHLPSIDIYNYATNDNAKVTLYVDDVNLSVVDTSTVDFLINKANSKIDSCSIGYGAGKVTPEQVNALNIAVDKAKNAETILVYSAEELQTLVSELNETISKFIDRTLEGVSLSSDSLPPTIGEDFEEITVDSSEFTGRWGSGIWRYYGKTPAIEYSDVCNIDVLPGNCLSIPSETAWNPVYYVPHNPNTYNNKVWGPDVYYKNETLEATFRFAVENTGVSDSQISIAYGNWFEIKLKNNYISEINGTSVNIEYNENESWNELKVLMFFDEDGNGKARVIFNGQSVANSYDYVYDEVNHNYKPTALQLPDSFDVTYDPSEVTSLDGGSVSISNSHLSAIKFYNYASNNNNKNVFLYVDDISLSIVDKTELTSLLSNAQQQLDTYKEQRTSDQSALLESYMTDVWSVVNTGELNFGEDNVALASSSDIDDLKAEFSSVISKYANNTLQAGEQNENSMTLNITNSGDEYTATFTRTVYVSESLDAVVVIAAYTDRGVVMSRDNGNGVLSIMVDDPDVGNTGSISASIDASSITPSVIKAFVFHDLSDMSPIIESASLHLND